MRISKISHSWGESHFSKLCITNQENRKEAVSATGSNNM